MSKEWPYDKLENLCIRIGDGLHGTPQYLKNTGYFFINGNNLTSGKIIISKDTKEVSKSEYERNYIELNENSLLLGINGTLGNLALYNNEYIILGKSAAYLNFKSGINRFFYYYFQLDSIQKYFYNVATGSTIKNLSLKSIQEFKVPVPAETEWKNIVAVLQSIDNKIALNTRMNDELEKAAQLTYDYWFFQYDFPDENGKPYKTSGGQMVWNEELKRKIPEGWEVLKINKVIEVKDGTHDSPKPKDAGFKLITSKNLKVEGLDFEGANYISEEDYISINKRSKVETGDILFSMIGSIGNIYKIDEEKTNFAIKNVALYKTSQKLEYKNYIYMYLRSYDMQRYMSNVISGSIQKFIGLGDLRNMPILMNDYYTEMFEEASRHIFKKLINIKLENQKLTELRDWLLPMLMNGQITINEVIRKPE